MGSRWWSGSSCRGCSPASHCAHRYGLPKPVGAGGCLLLPTLLALREELRPAMWGAMESSAWREAGVGRVTPMSSGKSPARRRAAEARSMAPLSLSDPDNTGPALTTTVTTPSLSRDWKQMLASSTLEVSFTQTPTLRSTALACTPRAPPGVSSTTALFPLDLRDLERLEERLSSSSSPLGRLDPGGGVLLLEPFPVEGGGKGYDAASTTSTWRKSLSPSFCIPAKCVA
mmetsp:Transcript_7558/g.11479  ORF Transcript_7558/g.11479 Transcript_7558/m.11479 type:complete len:229 (-) Transcript_7558:841-1527(-)